MDSPFYVKIKFIPKPDKILRIVHPYYYLNEITVKSNYSIKRIELIFASIIREYY